MSDILAIVIALCAVIGLFYYKQTTAKSVGKEYFYGIVGLFLLVALVAVLIDFYSNQPTPVASGFYTANIVSNTIYQNANNSVLYIYAVTQGMAAASMGGSSNTLGVVANESATYVGVGALTYNITEMVAVPAYWYYKFNYLGTTKFIAGYTNTT
jgi:hypothetical protein